MFGVHRLLSRGSTTALVSSRCQSHWSKVALAPPDKILGLNELFNNCNNDLKVNLGVGAYRDDKGKPFVLESVRLAEEIIAKSNPNHEYSSIGGLPAFVNHAIKFAYGEDSEAIASSRVAAVQSLSGTGACRLFAEFIAKTLGRETKVYLPNPTWGNHLAIMKNAGLVSVPYRYFDPVKKTFDFVGLLADVNNAPNGSVFLLHACAHNPTGFDPSHEQWCALSLSIKAKNHIVFFDCAYQGFASGDSERDAFAVRTFVKDGHNIILAQSFAKNFGLYGERIGALSVVTNNAEEAANVKSQLLLLIRPMYSNPPIYGARIVSTILSNPQLKALWIKECKSMSDRIHTIRSELRRELELAGSTHSWQHITDQIGMFCYSGLSTEQVLRLREEFHIFCTDDGRISIPGINMSNVKYVAQSIHACTKN